MKLIATTSQTVGPFFHIGLSHLYSSCTYEEGAAGRPIKIAGRILDGDGVPIPDAQLEFWQADAYGIYLGAEISGREPASAQFRGFARIAVDEQGGYTLCTIFPGQVIESDGSRQAPHIVVLAFFRGILRHLLTRIYFAGETSNEEDAVLQSVPQERRRMLIATPADERRSVYTWNIHMQGEHETVFFAC